MNLNEEEKSRLHGNRKEVRDDENLKKDLDRDRKQ